MIKIDGVSKKYENGVKSLDSISMDIKRGSVLGLIGTNGAGKSTLLRIMSGIFKADEGEVFVDGERVFENDRIKSKIAYVSDEQYLIPHFTLVEMAGLYKRFFKDFSFEKFYEMCKNINLDVNRKISTFSKGMKRQGEVILAISTMSDYLFFDETFDGLDPIARDFAKKAIAETVIENSRTVVLSSHNLTDIETICDSVSLIDGGKLVLHKSIDDILAGFHKYQMIFDKSVDDISFMDAFATLPHKSGKLITFISEENEDSVKKKMSAYLPDNTLVYSEAVELTLDEIFTLEVERVKKERGDKE